MRYRTVLLDVGETLIGPRQPYHEAYARVFHGLGLDPPVERFAEALPHTLQQFAARIGPGVDRFGFFAGGEEEYWRRFASACVERAVGGEVDPEVIARGVDELRDYFGTADAWRVYPDSVPALESLRELGVRLGVVSNWDARLPVVLQVTQLAGYFEEVGVSHVEGMEKPSPEIFHRVLRRMDASVEETLHVGDVPELDLEGARRAGIDGVLIDRRGRLNVSHESIEDLGELRGRVVDGAV